MTFNKLAISFLFTASLLLSGCGGDDSKSSSTSTTNTSAAVDTTTITTTSGKSIQVDKTANGFVFHGYEGQVILLEVYGDTCPHCLDAIPAYNRLQAKYANSMKVIALESYGTLTNAGMQQYDTVGKANTGKMFSFIKDLKGYNLQAVPYLMILSKDGTIVYDKILSDFPESDIDARIQQLL